MPPVRSGEDHFFLTTLISPPARSTPASLMLRWLLVSTILRMSWSGLVSVTSYCLYRGMGGLVSTMCANLASK